MEAVGDSGIQSSSGRGVSLYTGGPQGRKWFGWLTKRSITRQLSGGAFPCHEITVNHDAEALATDPATATVALRALQRDLAILCLCRVCAYYSCGVSPAPSELPSPSLTSDSAFHQAAHPETLGSKPAHQCDRAAHMQLDCPLARDAAALIVLQSIQGMISHQRYKRKLNVARLG